MNRKEAMNEQNQCIHHAIGGGPQGDRAVCHLHEKINRRGPGPGFNSLDAQRESAEAYIASQRHEKWLCISERYDDGGFTGGNMERPALKRLIADIEAGGIDLWWSTRWIVSVGPSWTSRASWNFSISTP
jgi:hypothetical protein